MTPDFDKTEKKRNVIPKLEVGFDFYTQSSTEYMEEPFISLNNRFPNLVGFGIIQYLKQLMAQDPSGKLVWSEDSIEKYANLMAIQKDLLLEVVNYCIKSLKMLRIVTIVRVDDRSATKALYYPKLMEHLIDLQVKRKSEAALYYQQFNIKKDSSVETPKEKRTRMIADLKAILELTTEEENTIKEAVSQYYAGVDYNTAWNDFKESCYSRYLEWHGQLTHSNKIQTFYIYLNNIKA